MTRRIWPQWRLALLLAGLCLGMILLALRGPDEAGTVNVSPAAADGSALTGGPTLIRKGDPPVYTPPPQSAFDIIVARNLFDVNRQPPPDSGNEDDSRSAQSKDFALEGILRTPALQIAILLDRRESKTVRVTLGEAYGGWTLDSVEDGFVILSRASETLRLELPRLIDRDAASGLTDQGLPRPHPVEVQPRRGDTEGNPVRARRRPLASQTIQPDS